MTVVAIFSVLLRRCKNRHKNIQNEQMDSPMEMGAQDHREQKRVRLSETLSHEMSKRPAVKAKPAYSPTIPPREIQFQDGEQESVAIVNREDPIVSKTINVYEARMGEKLDPKEMRKRKAKEVQEFDEFEVKMKVVKTEARVTPRKKMWSKWVETRKDPNKPWYESSGLSL